MTQEHPITPPPELFAEWFADTLRTLSRKVSEDDRGTTGLIAGAVAIQAARWGADMELDACCEWVGAISGKYGPRLRLARRPNPPSLKEQSLALIDKIQGSKEAWDISDLNVVRRALESLHD